jgi:hypothetical protein
MYWNNIDKVAGKEFARKIAEWIYSVQYPVTQNNPAAGAFPWLIYPHGAETHANNWNMAFAVMGLADAAEAFGENKYLKAAVDMARFLKTLQIFDPFKPHHYGAFREMTPQTPWCYTRDALSVAWSFLRLYEHTGDREYFERARLWGKWFFKQGLDEEGWPRWGVFFEEKLPDDYVQMSPELQGCFQGGSLNYLYQMGRLANDSRWTGEEYLNIANRLVDYIQQPDGLFLSVDRTSKMPPLEDPQNGLHRINDDLNSLGLLSAYKITGERKYLDSINKYINATFDRQKADGSFDSSRASIAIVLNILYEAGELLDCPSVNSEKVERAFFKLLSSQSTGRSNRRMNGGIVEEEGKTFVCARSSCYALIVLLKICAGIGGTLSVDRKAESVVFHEAAAVC